MKYNLWKNESKTIFCCLERALWKCTKGMIEICKLCRFWLISNFRILVKIKTCWNFWILFLKTVHQKGLLEQNICMRVMGRAYVWQVKVSRKPITYPLLTCIKNIGMLCVQELFLVGWVDYLKHVYILTKGKKSIKAEKNENVELSHTQVFCGRLRVLCE